DLVDGLVHLAPSSEKLRSVGSNRLTDVEMHIAIAEMAKRYRPAPGNNRFGGRARFLKKLGDSSNRDRHVNLDRAAFRFLDFRQNVPHMPERLCLIEA